jgi:hypothetical protein
MECPLHNQGGGPGLAWRFFVPQLPDCYAGFWR